MMCGARLKLWASMVPRALGPSLTSHWLGWIRQIPQVGRKPSDVLESEGAQSCDSEQPGTQLPTGSCGSETDPKSCSSERRRDRTAGDLGLPYTLPPYKAYTSMQY